MVVAETTEYEKAERKPSGKGIIKRRIVRRNDPSPGSKIGIGKVPQAKYSSGAIPSSRIDRLFVFTVPSQ